MHRRRPPGLRVRLVLALLLTSAVTLAVAALTLLPPLERRVRNEEVRALLSTAVSSRASFQDADLRPGTEPMVLAPLIRSLERRTGARIVLFDAGLRPVVDTRPLVGAARVDPEDVRDPFGDVGVALQRGRPVTTTVGGSQGFARALGAMQPPRRAQGEARRRSVATASHERRTPLASLHGVLELADDDLRLEPVDVGDARQQVGRARDQSRRLSVLAADLLDLSRLDADVELRREP